MLQVFNAYHNGKITFMRVIADVNNNAMNKLNKNITKVGFTNSELLKVLLDDNTCNDLEIQSIAARCSLIRLYDKILEYTRSQLFYSDVFEGLLNAYGNILFDAQCLDGHSLRRSSRFSNMEIFPLAKQMIEYNLTYQFPVLESSVFLLRQSIEVHIKRALGIKELSRRNKDGSLGSQIGISQIIKYMEQKIKDKKIAICVDIEVLKLINSWVNSYIHSGIFNYPFWYVELR